jgi:two-component system response regulator HydG
LKKARRQVSGELVDVNCATIRGDGAMSALFGHAKGAFTGATQRRRGLFVEADGGTLFLDEIGDMPLLLQAKLLRVLQSGEVRPVGSETIRTVDVRCIAATHHDLDGLVADGGFREDLFFRLNVLRVPVPPLRERREDVALLVEHFLAHSRSRVATTQVMGIRPEALEALAAHEWPGNVRELENLIERLVVTGSGQQIELAAVRESLRPGRAIDGLAGLLQDPIPLAQLEERYIAGVLERVGGNKARAAEILGVDLSTIYRWSKQPRG